MLANAPPVIASIVAHGGGAAQPANIANVGERVTGVSDRDGPGDAPEQLEYRWIAARGTFSGSGRSVIWQARATATPRKLIRAGYIV